MSNPLEQLDEPLLVDSLPITPTHLALMQLFQAKQAAHGIAEIKLTDDEIKNVIRWEKLKEHWFPLLLASLSRIYGVLATCNDRLQATGQSNNLPDQLSDLYVAGTIFFLATALNIILDVPLLMQMAKKCTNSDTSLKPFTNSYKDRAIDRMWDITGGNILALAPAATLGILTAYSIMPSFALAAILYLASEAMINAFFAIKVIWPADASTVNHLKIVLPKLAEQAEATTPRDSVAVESPQQARLGIELSSR